MEKMEYEVKKNLIWNNIFSFKFLVMYMITLIRTLTCFYYGGEFKYFGMFLINDDAFLTKVALGAFVLNFLMRLSVGKLYESFGLTCMYFVNIIINLGMSVSLLFYGHSYTAVFMFICFQRLSSGKNFSFLLGMKY